MKKLLILLLVTASASWADASAESDSVARGEYLTTILGCGGCHTEGALLGKPRSGDFWLAGSRVGIAYSEYDPDATPGIVFPGNLTPDRKTGLGRWSKADIVRLLRNGINHQGGVALPVMPWPNYSLLSDADASDIAEYLMSLPAVKRKIPENIEAGSPTTESYVRIGIFIYDPANPETPVEPCAEDC